jgi:hypothetical protein
LAASHPAKSGHEPILSRAFASQSTCSRSPPCPLIFVARWNLPVHGTFRSTNIHGFVTPMPTAATLFCRSCRSTYVPALNAFGERALDCPSALSPCQPTNRWPRMLLQVYSKGSNGSKVMRGYGSVLIPTFAGARTCYVHLFKPKSSTIIQVRPSLSDDRESVLLAGCAAGCVAPICRDCCCAAVASAGRSPVLRARSWCFVLSALGHHIASGSRLTVAALLACCPPGSSGLDRQAQWVGARVQKAGERGRCVACQHARRRSAAPFLKLKPIVGVVSPYSIV